MGYGARARRVPAKGGAVLTDVDIFKVLMIGKAERGIIDSVGLPILQEEIYSMNDYFKKCGGNNNSYYTPYVAQAFFEELQSDISCEMKVMSWLSADSTQAAYSIMDTASSAAKIFDIKAGRKGLNDKSAFGNKVAIKITHISPITMKLAGNVADTDVSVVLDSVDNLTVGNYIKFVDGVKEEVRKILTIVPATKTVTFDAISEATGFAAATATVYRLDWRLEIGVKDDLGDYQKMETWEAPFAQSNSIGLASLVNNTVSGSDFVILAVDSTNASAPEDQIPTELTSWTALTGGSDGTAAVDANYKTLANTYCGNAEFTILLAPESSSITHNNNMAEFCTDQYRGVYYAQSSNGATEDTLKNFGASLRGSIKFAMIPSDKWIKVNDPTVIEGTKDIPMVGCAAAHWFNTYQKYGESKVAAGNKSEMVLKTSSVLLDSNGLVHDDVPGVGGRLIRNYSVNISRFKRGKGITINSARTLSTDDGYKYQNQLFQFILYARSIVAYLREIEQDRSGVKAQEQHWREVWRYMKAKYDAGHLFQGQKEDGSLTKFEDVCIIVNDFTINTLADLNNGIEQIFMQFVAVNPIEEPILNLASAAVTSVRG